MDIQVRDVREDDFPILTGFCSPEASGELANYRDSHLKPSSTGFPETIFVAELGGRVAGFVHFFVDIWDGDEKNLISLASDPSLPASEGIAVKTTLRTKFESYNPQD